jgi:uncharacterized protein YegL
VTIPRRNAAPADLIEADAQLKGLFAGQVEEFFGWICQRVSAQSHAFELAARETDLEEVGEFVRKRVPPDSPTR